MLTIQLNHVLGSYEQKSNFVKIVIGLFKHPSNEDKIIFNFKENV